MKRQRSTQLVSLLSLLVLPSVQSLGVLPPYFLDVKSNIRHKRQPLFGTASASELKPNTDDDLDLNVDISQISDAETLLACLAYLKRRNKLGWKEFEQRKKLQQQSSALFPCFAKDSVGYFWEDPSELQCSTSSDGSRPTYGDTFEEDDPNLIQQPRSDQVVFEDTDVGDESVYGSGGVFTTYPSGPSEERLRRSHAKTVQWSDDEFRKRWYEKRWAGKTLLTDAVKRDRLMDERLQALPPDIFESDEIAAMTDEEIHDAIVTYVLSNKRRSKSLKMRTSFYNETRTDQKLPRDALFAPNEDLMKEKQRIRSERAKASYQKRLENQGVPSIHPTTRNTRMPRGTSPKDALARVSLALDLQQLPTLQDVTTMLKPNKLGRRTDLLRRILNEHFSLRGKCVPIDLDKPEEDCIFVTKASIEQLGKFVVKKMEERLT